MTAVWELDDVRAGIETQLAALAQLEGQGARLIGWKVGVGAPAAMQTAGIPAPLVGFLTSATVLESGASVPLEGWVRPMLEPEIAIWIGSDVEAKPTETQARDAISGIGPAIELADVDRALTDLTGVVGGDIFHRAVIFGEADEQRRGGVVDDLRVTVEGAGGVIAETDDVTSLTGAPVQLVVHVASWLAAAGRGLEAGQVIIGGSVVPIIPVSPGDAVTYHAGDLGNLAVSFQG